MPTVAGIPQVPYAADDSTGRGLVAVPGLSRKGVDGQVTQRMWRDQGSGSGHPRVKGVANRQRVLSGPRHNHPATLASLQDDRALIHLR